jgi:hypothetical protein
VCTKNTTARVSIYTLSLVWLSQVLASSCGVVTLTEQVTSGVVCTFGANASPLLLMKSKVELSVVGAAQ